MKTVLVVLAALLAGCTSVHDLGNGRYIVPRLAEVRSPFGTNAGFVRLEDCFRTERKEEGLQPLYPTVEYVDCQEVTDWRLVSSPGQGGHIVSGLLQGAGMVGLGALLPASQTTLNGGNASATTSVNASATSSAAATGGPVSVTGSIVNGGIHNK